MVECGKVFIALHLLLFFAAAAVTLAAGDSAIVRRSLTSVY